MVSKACSLELSLQNAALLTGVPPHHRTPRRWCWLSLCLGKQKRGDWSDRHPNDIFALCPKRPVSFYYFLTSKYPTLFVNTKYYMCILQFDCFSNKQKKLQEKENIPFTWFKNVKAGSKQNNWSRNVNKLETMTRGVAQKLIPWSLDEAESRNVTHKKPISVTKTLLENYWKTQTKTSKKKIEQELCIETIWGKLMKTQFTSKRGFSDKGCEFCTRPQFLLHPAPGPRGAPAVQCPAPGFGISAHLAGKAQWHSRWSSEHRSRQTFHVPARCMFRVGSALSLFFFPPVHMRVVVN